MKTNQKNRYGSLICFLLVLCLGGCGSLFHLGHGERENTEISIPVLDPIILETASAPEQEGLSNLHPNLEEAQAEAREQIPGFDGKYYLTQLCAGELQDVCALYRTLMAFEEKCQLPCELTRDQLEKVYTLLYFECPELIQFAGEKSYQYWSKGNTGMITEVEPQYTMDSAAYSQAAVIAEEKMSELCGGLEGMSPWEQETEIYRRIVLNYTYDLSTENCGSAYGLLTEGKAKCVGAARTAKWAFDRLGIPNYILGGAALREEAEEGHVWNVVQLDGAWYDFDATFQFDSPEEIVYPAVNVSRRWIRDQYQIYPLYLNFDLPGSESMAGSYYGRQGNFVPTGTFVREVLFQRLTECYDAGGGSFTLQIEDEAAYQDLVENVDSYLQEWTDNSGGAWWNAGKYWVESYRLYRISVEVLE